MSTLQKLYQLLKSNIPAVPLVLYTAINTTAFSSCADDTAYLTGFWVFYPLLCVVCVCLEFMHAWTTFETNYGRRQPKTKIGWVVGKVMMSMLLFVAITYHIGGTFQCLFPYTQLVSNILFYCSLGVLAVFVGFEHMFLVTTTPKPDQLNSFV